VSARKKLKKVDKIQHILMKSPFGFAIFKGVRQDYLPAQ
jgi:hypothetical protein